MEKHPVLAEIFCARAGCFHFPFGILNSGDLRGFLRHLRTPLIWLVCLTDMRNAEIGRAIMKLKNTVIVVNDIEHSKQFYHDLFGLDQVLDQDGNLILTEGLVLQDRRRYGSILT